MASATSAEGRFCHPVIKILQQGNVVQVQPADASGGAGIETLHLDLSTGKAHVAQAQEPLRGATLESLGLLGVCDLQKGCCLVAITEARKVADVGLSSAAVYELAGAKVLAAPNAASVSKDNRRLLKLLQDAVDPSASGRGIFFSHFYDITLSSQRIADRDANPETARAPLAARADPRFWYNRSLAQPLVAVNAHRFTPPAILGFITQLPDLNFSTAGKPASATLTLIARRGADRVGTRQWRRGADPNGNVANFVETEEVLTTPAGDLASFVEIRGSIPLLWTQLPNIKYKPTTVIAAAGESSAAFDAHFAALSKAYGDVTAINLINHKGTEGKLEVAFRTEALRSSGMHYVAFDFHHECSKGRYHRLSLLWDTLKSDFERHGFFLVRGGKVERRQGGVMRTNCIDCLDRTNVVQGILGRKALEAMLASLGLMDPAGSRGLPDAFPAVEKEFKILWADHGDAVSNQYAGTGAMKSGFTRTGKRTFGGVIDDGVKAVVRYYLNNFQDGVKQDAIDLMSGAYCVAPGCPVPLKPQPSPLVPIVLGLMLVLYGVYHAAHAASGDAAAAAGPIFAFQAAAADAADEVGQARLLRAAVANVLLPLALGVGLLFFVVKNGKHLVNKPQLCPHLAVTVQPPPKKK